MAMPKQILTSNEKALIIALYEMEAVDTDIAKVLKMAYSTFKDVCKYNGIADTIKKSKGIANLKVKLSLYKSAIGGNFGAQVYWLCNRDPLNWKNIQKIESRVDNTSIEKIVDGISSILNGTYKEVIDITPKLTNGNMSKIKH